jgi:hypothetical protein
MFVAIAPDYRGVSVTDFLDETRKEITKRLEELKPVVDEFNRLEAAAVALAGAVGSAASEATSAVAGAVTGRRGRGRPRGSGKRSGKRTRKAARASAVAVTADATPVVQRKKPPRPKGSGKKVGRPAGSAKKAGRPAAKVGSSAGKVGTSKARRGGRPKGSGKRASEALSLVQGQPGITIPELAAKMGIKQNYLYRVLPGLEQDGKLEKKGRGWHPKAA